MALSLKDKVYGLSLIWKETEYNSPFWIRLSDLDWDKAYDEALEEVLKSETDREYYLILMKFLALIRDGHTGVNPPNEIVNGFGALPVQFKLINGKYYIIFVDEKLDIPQFTELKAINNMPVDEYLETRIYPYIWHEKPDSGFWQINKYLPLIEYGNEITITTEYGDLPLKCSKDVKYKHPDLNVKIEEELTVLFDSLSHKISKTKDDIIIIKIPTFMRDELKDEYYKNLELIKDCNCKGIIFDVRNNGGGNSGNGDTVSQSFFEGQFKVGIDLEMVHIGTYKAWGKGNDFSNWDMSNEWQRKVYEITNRCHYAKGEYNSYTPDCPMLLTQPVVILMNEATGSAAEDFVITFDNADRATLVGTATYGSTGQPIFWNLPSGGSFRVCTRWSKYPDGREFINIGVKPHIEASLSVDDYKNGIDSVFAKGLEVMRDKIDKIK